MHHLSVIVSALALTCDAIEYKCEDTNSCAGETYICASDICSFDCKDNRACYNSTFICVANGTNECSVECNAAESCSHSTMIKLVEFVP